MQAAIVDGEVKHAADAAPGTRAECPHCRCSVECAVKGSGHYTAKAWIHTDKYQAQMCNAVPDERLRLMSERVGKLEGELAKYRKLLGDKDDACKQLLRERLAQIEHEQWEHWAKGVAHEVSPERRRRWQEEYMIPYEELPEDAKEHDRKWAKEVLRLLRKLVNEELVNDLDLSNGGLK